MLLTEGRIEVPGKWGGRCKPLLYYLKVVRGYWKFKEEGKEHTLSRTHLKRQWICHRADYRMNEWINEWMNGGKFKIYISALHLLHQNPHWQSPITLTA